MSNINLYYLEELPDFKVASDNADVSGWALKDAEKRIVGRVDDLLVNRETRRVVYLDVEIDQGGVEYKRLVSVTSSGKMESGHLIVPIELVDIG